MNIVWALTTQTRIRGFYIKWESELSQRCRDARIGRTCVPLLLLLPLDTSPLQPFRWCEHRCYRAGRRLEDFIPLLEIGSVVFGEDAAEGSVASVAAGLLCGVGQRISHQLKGTCSCSQRQEHYRGKPLSCLHPQHYTDKEKSELAYTYIKSFNLHIIEVTFGHMFSLLNATCTVNQNTEHCELLIRVLGFHMDVRYTISNSPSKNGNALRLDTFFYPQPQTSKQGVYWNQSPCMIHTPLSVCVA